MRKLAHLLLIKCPTLTNLIVRILGAIDPRFQVSSHYALIDEKKAAQEAARLATSWTAASIPARQRQLVDRELRSFRAGLPIRAFDVFVELLRKHSVDMGFTTILEIGCSSGYYSEVLRSRGLSFRYTGCDYSEAFIDMAKAKYPQLDFHVEDATRLGYADACFDVVVSGCCLLHIPDYERALAETVRVSRSQVLFHRTPLVVGRPTEVFTKNAYGVETVEIHLSQALFYELLEKNGLEVLETSMISCHDTDRGPTEIVSILCRKAGIKSLIPANDSEGNNR